MTSKADDLPSCSKMNMEGTKVGDIIINKYPVVVLTKLDPDILSFNLNTEDIELFKKQQQTSSLVSLHRKPEVNKSYSYDEDTALSDVSVSLSDDEKVTSEEIKSNRSYKKGVIETTKVELKKNSVFHETDKSESEGKKTYCSDKKIIVAESDRSQKKNASEKRPSGVKVLLDGKENKNETGSSSQKSEPQVKDVKKENLMESDSLLDNDKPHKKSSFKSDRCKTLKQPAETESSNIAKSVKEAVEKIIPQQDETRKEKKHNPNTRYKLTLGPFSVFALESESFRKFINLASDCVINFNKKQAASSPLTGYAVLFFGDYLTLQSAMQRLSQLSGFTDKLVKGNITCMEIRQLGKNVSKDQWKADLAAKLFFQFNTDKREKLQQLISSKGRKKEDTKRKCVQVHRIPSSVNEEMLSLLFPFSLGVKISGTESSEKDIKGPVEIEFESQEWMEAVLNCFREFSVSTNKMQDRIFSLIIKNFTPTKDKPQDNTPLSAVTDKQKQVTSSLNKTNLNQRDRNINRIRSSNTKNLGAGLERNPRPLLQRTPVDKLGLAQSRDDQRKRTYPGTNFGQRGIDNREPVSKRVRLDNSTQARGLTRMDMIINEAQSQQIAQVEAHQDALRQMAHVRGLDSSNPDVIKILEMTTQLEKLQNMTEQQNAEAKSLGFVRLPGHQVFNEHLQQKVLALKQAQEEAEVRRFQAAVQAKNLHLRELEEASQAGSSWPHSENLLQNLEIARRREEEERLQLEMYETNRGEINRKEMIADRFKHLEERDMLSRQGMPFQREGYKGTDRDSRPSLNYFSNKGGGSNEFAAKKIQTFGHAPATSGLLGAAPGDVPSVLDEQQKARENIYNANNGSSFGHKGGRIFEKNMQRNKSIRQQSVSHNQSSSSRSVSRAQQFNKMIPQKSPKSAQTFRKRSHDIFEDNRQEQDFSAQNPNIFDQMSVDPDRNDMPLDFNRPLARLTTEQAFKQDIERTRAVLGTQVNPATGRSFRPKPILKTTKPLLEEVRDRHGLPVQFGKNAAKKTPRQIQDDRRQNVRMNQNTVGKGNARNLSSVNAFKNVSGIQDQTIKERWNTGPHSRGGPSSDNFQDEYKEPPKIGVGRKTSFGVQRDIMNVRSSRGLIAQGGEVNNTTSSQNLSRGGVNMKNVQRERLFNSGLASPLTVNQNRSSEQVSAYDYDTQWKRNLQEKSRSNEMASNREQELGRGQASTIWNQIRERQMFLEHGQERPQGQLHHESDVDYGRNEWNKHGGQFLERSSGYRVVEEHSEQSRSLITGLNAKPLYEEDSYFDAAQTRRPYNNVQKLTRAEKGQISYDQYEEYDNYAGTANLGNESYQTSHGLSTGKRGHSSQTVGSRCGLLGRESGHGNINDSAQGRGLLTFRKNAGLPEPGSGRGLLELPEHFKQQESAYYGEGNDAISGAERGNFHAQSQLHSVGRNSLMSPPAPLIGHGVNFY